MIKSDSKDILFYITFYFEFCSSKWILRKKMVYTGMVILNNKQKLHECQISILEWFLKNRDTEDWSNSDAENS